MAVKVGSARHDENGNLRGGKAGDQTGVEVSKQNWYKHKKGWVVIRPKDETAREKIAKDMEYACANANIGYDQSQNHTLFNVAKKVGFDCSKVTEKCETDCSRLVRVCLWYAGIEVPVFYTGNQVETLEKTGKFQILTSPKYTESSDYLLRGDILVTKVTGHTVVVLNNGAKATEKTPEPTKEEKATVKKGSNNSTVKELQIDLILLGFKDSNKVNLVVDGDFGSKTDYAVREYQSANKLKVDGIVGPKTWAALEKSMSKVDKSLKVIEATANVYIRKGPAKSYASIKILKKGRTAVWNGKTSGKWYNLFDVNGWIHSDYIKVL